MKPKGTSIIDHSIRFKLKLTVEEYILCDLIYQFNKRYRIGSLTYNKYLSTVGFLPEDVLRIGKSLKQKGFITDGLKQKRIVTTKLWDDNFDDDAQFEQLWTLHPKGNKAEARESFMKSIRITGYNLLVEKLQDYINFQPNFQFRLKLSNWLDPKLKHWEDELVYNGQNAKEETSTDDNSIPSTLFR
jgi:hypothetical protein